MTIATLFPQPLPQPAVANLMIGEGNPPALADHHFFSRQGPCGTPRNHAEEIENARLWAQEKGQTNA